MIDYGVYENRENFATGYAYMCETYGDFTRQAFDYLNGRINPVMKVPKLHIDPKSENLLYTVTMSQVVIFFCNIGNFCETEALKRGSSCTESDIKSVIIESIATGLCRYNQNYLMYTGENKINIAKYNAMCYAANWIKFHANELEYVLGVDLRMKDNYRITSLIYGEATSFQLITLEDFTVNWIEHLILEAYPECDTEKVIKHNERCVISIYEHKNVYLSISLANGESIGYTIKTGGHMNRDAIYLVISYLGQELIYSNIFDRRQIEYGITVHSSTDTVEFTINMGNPYMLPVSRFE